MTSFKITQTFPVSSETLYNAWLDSVQHTAMTGGEAICSDKEDDSFSAWDGYIKGVNKKLVESKEIIQSWRTAEFKDSDPDSMLSISFRDIAEGCELTLIHSDIPEGQPDYEQGWKEHYFEPIQDYFSK